MHSMTFVADRWYREHRYHSSAKRQKTRSFKALCPRTDELHFFVQYTVASADRCGTEPRPSRAALIACPVELVLPVATKCSIVCFLTVQSGGL
jgi:hypothetical protein